MTSCWLWRISKREHRLPLHCWTREHRRDLDLGWYLHLLAEGFNGRIRAPFFGQPVRLEGNYAIIARMARKTNALTSPLFIFRENGASFALKALEPLRLPTIDAPEEQLAEDVAFLNAVIELMVGENPEQWHFVDNRMPAVHI